MRVGGRREGGKAGGLSGSRRRSIPGSLVSCLLSACAFPLQLLAVSADRLPPSRSAFLPCHPPAFPPSRHRNCPIAVLTMGPGGEVWERFGHNAIVVEDHQQGTSVALQLRDVQLPAGEFLCSASSRAG